MFEQRYEPLVLPQSQPQEPEPFFSFVGFPATITITKADGTKLMDAETAAQLGNEEPQNGN